MNDFRQPDLDAFADALHALRADLRAEVGEADLEHMRKLSLWGRLCTAVGLLATGLFPNPVAWFGLGLGNFARWAIVAHHTIHRGLDRAPGLPAQHKGNVFARGWRRFVHWFDWMYPQAWHHEHDVLHHYQLGEAGGDPDIAEDNAFWLRDSRLPMWARRGVVLFLCGLWKPLYYAPNTLNALLNAEGEKHGRPPVATYSWESWVPWKPRVWSILWRCWLPYITSRFVLLPALFLLWSPTAALYALINLLLGELVANVWSFWVIVPNHTGDDLERFETPLGGRADFYYRQVAGSTNYRTGGDLNDFLHGWLNYQIEHHLFPDLPPLKYQQAQARVAKICAEHDVPYVQQSIFRRMAKTMDILIGATSMRRGRG